MRVRTLLPILALASLSACASAQDGQAMISGGGHALTLHPDGLSDNYIAVQIKTTVQSGNGIFDMLMNPLMMLMGALGGMGGEDKSQPPTALLTAIDLDWTTGETQALFGQTYLIVYKLDFDPGKLTPNTKDLSGLDLRLQFIRTDTIASFTPRPDITSAEYMKMLKTPLPKPSEPPAEEPAKPEKS